MTINRIVSLFHVCARGFHVNEVNRYFYHFHQRFPAEYLFAHISELNIWFKKGNYLKKNLSILFITEPLKESVHRFVSLAIYMYIECLKMPNPKGNWEGKDLRKLFLSYMYYEKSYFIFYEKHNQEQQTSLFKKTSNTPSLLCLQRWLLRSKNERSFICFW